MKKIHVTKTFLPPIEEFQRYLDKIWANGQLTNQGPLLGELEPKLKNRLGVEYCQVVTNGTIALQLALRALDVTDGEVITTPFSYVASTSAILWERCDPVFVDIDRHTFCIDANKIEAAITPRTKAILAVHVFGNPCDIKKINAIAKKHNLKVIYDGAHAFGVETDGQSLLNNGDISVCSFHSTKLFHTIEGGCIIAKDKRLDSKVDLMKRFGHNGDEHFMLGINAKASEFQAAMGLCNLNHLDDIIQARKALTKTYDAELGDSFQTLSVAEGTTYNYAYYPVVLESEKQLIDILKHLEKENIFPRRYFYPSLNTLPYLTTRQPCPISEDITKRILCLPLYAGLEQEIAKKICEVMKA